MLPLVALDTSLLAVPNTANDQIQAEEILGRIIDWAGCLRPNTAVHIARAYDAADVLAIAGVFPSGPNIRALLEMFGLTHVYTAEDLRKSINAILERAPAILDIMAVEVQQCSEYKADPDLFSLYDDVRLRDASARMLSSLLLGPRVSEIWEGCTYMVPGVLPSQTKAAAISFSGRVDALMPASTQTEIDVPLTTEGTVQLARSYCGLLECLEPDMIWSKAEEPQSVHLAIGLEALRILKGLGSDATIRAVPSFAIGTAFWDSLNRNAAGSGGPFGAAVRERCARVLLGQTTSTASPFRVRPPSKRGKWQHAERHDGARGFRTHIRKSHEALRLMYWELKPPAGRGGPIIEFANIGPKHELVIADGDPAASMKASW